MAAGKVSKSRARGTADTPRARGTADTPRVSGFTLLELMVVAVIIAIIVSLALPNIAGSAADRQLRTESERLQAVMNLMCERAAREARVLGIAIGKDQYQVLLPIQQPVRSAQANDASTAPPRASSVRIVWREVPGISAFQAHRLAKGFVLNLEFPDAPRNSVRVAENARTITLENADLELPEVPQLVCAGSRELSPFELQIALGDANASLRNSEASLEKIQLQAVQLHILR